MTLEELKELATVISVWPCRVVTFEFNDETGDVRYVVELPGVKLASFPQAKRLGDGINALPDLIAVVEAAKWMRKYKVTLDTVALIGIDYNRTFDAYTSAASDLDAALAKLEAAHED